MSWKVSMVNLVGNVDLKIMGIWGHNLNHQRKEIHTAHLSLKDYLQLVGQKRTKREYLITKTKMINLMQNETLFPIFQEPPIKDEQRGNKKGEKLPYTTLRGYFVFSRT